VKFHVLLFSFVLIILLRFYKASIKRGENEGAGRVVPTSNAL
jgi:hypothetical protein